MSSAPVVTVPLRAMRFQNICSEKNKLVSITETAYLELKNAITQKLH